ncbi:MAG: hypothetical protein QG597_4278 [Actinomycetota bacterium]|nr:hypothetical protein [Actinomycetota bacterium]
MANVAAGSAMLREHKSRVYACRPDLGTQRGMTEVARAAGVVNRPIANKPCVGSRSGRRRDRVRALRWPQAPPERVALSHGRAVIPRSGERATSGFMRRPRRGKVF